MSQQTQFDPFKMWKEFYDQSEAQWGKMFDESMHKEDFSEWMGHFLNVYLQYQNMVKQSTEKYLEHANFPSRADISNIASLIVNLETKVEGLEEIVETEVVGKTGNASLSKEIDSLKAEVKSIDDKINQIFELVKKQSEQFSLATTETASAVEKKPKK